MNKRKSRRRILVKKVDDSSSQGSHSLGRNFIDGMNSILRITTPIPELYVLHNVSLLLLLLNKPSFLSSFEMSYKSLHTS